MVIIAAVCLIESPNMTIVILITVYTFFSFFPSHCDLNPFIMNLIFLCAWGIFLGHDVLFVPQIMEHGIGLW